jgi:hypothetical protein
MTSHWSALEAAVRRYPNCFVRGGIVKPDDTDQDLSVQLLGDQSHKLGDLKSSMDLWPSLPLLTLPGGSDVAILRTRDSVVLWIAFCRKIQFSELTNAHIHIQYADCSRST